MRKRLHITHLCTYVLLLPNALPRDPPPPLRCQTIHYYPALPFPQDRGFLYVHTPIVTGSDCEGAGEMFQVTTLLPTDPKKVCFYCVFFGRFYCDFLPAATDPKEVEFYWVACCTSSGCFKRFGEWSPRQHNPGDREK